MTESGKNGEAEEARPRVLVVDDEPDIVTMISTVLRREYDVITASDGAAACEIVTKETLDAVVADHMMPGMTGVELLDRCNEALPDAARILVTASDQVDVLKEAVNRARVHRFVSKPLRLKEMLGLVRGAMREAGLESENRRLVAELETKNLELNTANERLEQEVKDRTAELELAIDQLKQLALKDGLTGLYNHRYFQEFFGREISRAKRYDHQVSLLFVDVDHFKAYNDKWGHPAGDRLLTQLAAVLTGGGDSGLPPSGRISDVVARYGGEEFVLVLPETNLAGAGIKAERIRKAVEGYKFHDIGGNTAGGVSVSIGVASYPQHGGDKAELIKCADAELYKAKAAGRNCVCVATETAQAE